MTSLPSDSSSRNSSFALGTRGVFTVRALVSGLSSEVKWDGFRALVRQDERLLVRSRRGCDMTAPSDGAATAQP
jgi:hypothetical protein